MMDAFTRERAKKKAFYIYGSFEFILFTSEIAIAPGERESCRPGPTPAILSKIALKLYVVPVNVGLTFNHQSTCCT